MFDFFPRPKPATLPRNVINAVCLYNQPEHQVAIKEWLKQNDLNAVDSNGYSILHYAALSGRTKLVEFFLKKGVQKDLEDSRGYTALILAAQEVHAMTGIKRKSVHECMQQLLTHSARTVSSGPLPQVAMNLAALNGDLETLKLLEQHGAALNEDIMGTPLWWALNSNKANKNAEVIVYLENKGCTSRINPTEQSDTNSYRFV